VGIGVVVWSRHPFTENQGAPEQILGPAVILLLTVDLAQIVQQRRVLDAVRVVDLLGHRHRTTDNRLRLLEIAGAVTKVSEREQAAHKRRMVRTS
jgi:hypothetical protein